ncbi:MAG: DinB family protein [Bryobacteraceae bacterium]
MNHIRTLTIMGALLGAAALNAQNPLSNDLKNSYNGIKGTITKAADEMAEADYSFKASPMERTYGAIVGHIADVQMALCGNAQGEQKMGDAEKTKTTKADLVAALKASFDYCDAAYNGMTDADAAKMVTMFGPRKATKIAVLNFNIAHDNEMYGQMVVYLRIKGLVPPSSQRRQP